jgi:uncharacterized protein (TIGR02646 family)
MHKLDRSLTPYPACLNRYKHGFHNWSNISSIDKDEIRIALQSMQGRRCAYCECDLSKHDYHIEHFRQRNRFPQGTFDWNNLFLSCGSSTSCGIHKDKCPPYNPNVLIKPDIEDPEVFFLFVQDGSIVVRPNLTDAERHRAEETLRIFNLDAQGGPLRQMRRVAISGYLKTLIELQELSEIFSIEQINEYVASEYGYITDSEFCTPIKHALTLQGVS